MLEEVLLPAHPPHLATSHPSNINKAQAKGVFYGLQLTRSSEFSVFFHAESAGRPTVQSNLVGTLDEDLDGLSKRKAKGCWMN